jgi:large subunit ribosomal protein L3
LFYPNEKKIKIIMKFIIGKKINMTQVWQGDQAIGVTKVQAGPCVIVQVKNKEKDGYEAVQIGYGEKKEKRISKPQRGHMAELGNLRYLREFRTETTDLQRGNKIDVSVFTAGDIVDVTGVSKGKGFQGVVKRHGFHGHNETHGTKDSVRMPGSIGATGPAHVFKGMRMPGHMGDEQVTTKNLEIIKVDEANNILYIKGSVPGATNGLLLIKGAGELKIKSAEEKIAEPTITAEENIEEVATDTVAAADNEISNN